MPRVVGFKIIEELEKISTLYKFDLVDFSDPLVSENFKSEVLKNIEYVK